MSINSISLNNNFLKQNVNNHLSFKSKYEEPKTSSKDAQDYYQYTQAMNSSMVLPHFNTRNDIEIGRNETTDIETENLVQESFQGVVKEANAKARAVKDASTKIYYDAKNTKFDANRLYRNVQDPNYQGNAVLEDDVIRTYDDEGNLLKEFGFYPDGEVRFVDEKDEKRFTEYENGEPVKVTLGLERHSDDSYKYEKELEFEKDEYGLPSLKSYSENFVWNSFDSRKNDLLMKFENGKLWKYAKGFELSDGVWKTADELIMSYGFLPYCYIKNDSCSPADGIKKREAYAIFENASFLNTFKPIRFEKDLSYSPEDGYQIGLQLEFKDGKWQEIK